MKHFFTAILGFTLLSLSACTSTDAVKEVRGYPVYKFINLGSINTLNKTGSRKLLGENYNAYAEQQQIFISHGFNFHTPLKVQKESGDEIEVYIRNKDYRELWKVSPHDLAKQNKSHRVTITYSQHNVGSKIANRAVTFDSKLVDREPIIRK